MTLHKLSAGSGYEYLTRQVTAQDTTETRTGPSRRPGPDALTNYYATQGEAPGRWVGSGLVGIRGLAVGDPVTAEQMRHLFGAGQDPLTGEALGAAYRVHGESAGERAGFEAEVTRRLAVGGTTGGTQGGTKPGTTSDAAHRLQDRAAVRSQVARELFIREHGREPRDARELAGAVTRYARPRRTTVAGYDLTFSPVKSASTLWAVAPREVTAVIEAAHDAAVADAVTFLEQQVLFTRQGKDGARQVQTRALVAAAFTHRDSRAGDPDLHTHVAIANNVQTLDGAWLAIYGRVLHQHVVAASET